jgi:ankyrin repeat protein
MYAVQNRNTTLLEYLLDRGANPSLRNNDGENAIIVAARVNNGDAVESLLARNIRGINEVSTKNPRKNAFMWACDHDNIEMVRALLPKIDLTVDFPAEARDLDGPLPALLWAINYRKSDSVINEIIYNYPGNLRDVKDRNGRDAMYYAKKENKGVAALTNRVKSYDNAVNTQGGSW